MAVAAAIRITSSDDARVIEHAAAFARQRNETCYVISIVSDSAYSYVSDDQADVVRRNLALVAEQHASPIVQQGDDVAEALAGIAPLFGITTMFLQSGNARRLGRTIAEQLLLLAPPFDVVVIGSG